MMITNGLGSSVVDERYDDKSIITWLVKDLGYIVSCVKNNPG